MGNRSIRPTLFLSERKWSFRKVLHIARYMWHWRRMEALFKDHEIWSSTVFPNQHLSKRNKPPCFSNYKRNFKRCHSTKALAKWRFSNCVAICKLEPLGPEIRKIWKSSKISHGREGLWKYFQTRTSQHDTSLSIR